MQPLPVAVLPHCLPHVVKELHVVHGMNPHYNEAEVGQRGLLQGYTTITPHTIGAGSSHFDQTHPYQSQAAAGVRDCWRLTAVGSLFT